MIKKTYKEINEKIENGEVVVVTAEEVIDIVAEKGIKEATKLVDVVTTGTFGPMCSSGAFLNFGHSDPPIRMNKVTLNNVEAYSGLAAVDAYIGAAGESEDRGKEYGGAHVICDLIDGKEIELKASANPTDCYPRKNVDTTITLNDLNEAYLYNPRNAYQNYSAAINDSDKRIYTYMGILQANRGNINYSTAGELSPLLNDPYYRTIGIGTRIFLCGAQGFISWQGTQFNSSAQRDNNGIPIGTGGTLAVTGNLKDMDTKYIKPAVFENYGTSIFIGIGIPIPILDEEIMKMVSIRNKDIYTNIIDYSAPIKNKPTVSRVSYEELRSGEVVIDGKSINTAPLSSLKKAREIAKELKEWIIDGKFHIQEPIKQFSLDSNVKAMKSKGE